MDWPALAAAILGPTVGLAALYRSGADARESRQQALELTQQQHRHERELRRSERLFARRAKVYEEFLRLTFRSMITIERTQPVEIGVALEPPARPSDDEWIAAEARIAAFGSADVLSAAVEYTRLAREFFSRARTWQAMRDAEAAAVQLADAGDAAIQARARAREYSREVERIVREELASL